MKIQQQVTEHLERLVAEGPKAVDAALLSGQDQGYIVGINTVEGPTVCITLRDHDRYSITMRRLEVYPTAKAESELAAYAEQVARRLTYLEEPLALIELDVAEDVALLRSQPPHRGGEATIYWEVKINTRPTPKVWLARYRWTPAYRERELLHYPITFGAVGRIAADLVLSTC